MCVRAYVLVMGGGVRIGLQNGLAVKVRVKLLGCLEFCLTLKGNYSVLYRQLPLGTNIDAIKMARAQTCLKFTGKNTKFCIFQ
jgi:hypothetical protein